MIFLFCMAALKASSSHLSPLGFLDAKPVHFDPLFPLSPLMVSNGGEKSKINYQHQPCNVTFRIGNDASGDFNVPG